MEWDGPLKTVTFDVSPSQPAYSVNYPERRVERSFNLEQPESWERVFTFVSTSPMTNWSDNLDDQADKAFYRVTCPASP